MAMETVTRFTERYTGAGVDTSKVAPIESARALPVTVSYLLSEEGRKASLLGGGNGHEVQQLTVQVPANRLHLVTVDKLGNARLKLQPRFELDANQRVVRVDALPTYDAPPSIDDLFRAAARNHELERTYQTQRNVARAKRLETERELRERIAIAFMNDPSQRALPHPPPTPQRCCIVSEQRRLIFTTEGDLGIAQQVPAEACRRFRADLRAKRERVQQERTAQLALHEEKKRFMAEWIPLHGTQDRQVRQAAGVLPMEEAVQALTDHTFTGIGQRSLYLHDGAERLQSFLRQLPAYSDSVVSQPDLAVTSMNAVKATRTQWAVVQELQAAKADATVTLRIHRLSWKRDPTAPSLTVFGVLVTCKVGPFTVRREYLAPSE
jgi:hypothetical protein